MKIKLIEQEQFKKDRIERPVGQDAFTSEITPSFGVEVEIEDCFNGIGIRTESGLYGIAMRDGGIEIMLDGVTILNHSKLYKNKQLSSKYDIGEKVLFNMINRKYSATVLGIHFYEGKIFYDLEVILNSDLIKEGEKPFSTILNTVDSALVEEIKCCEI